MEKYLTGKVRPGKGVLVMEKAALVAMTLLIGVLVHVAVYGWLWHGPGVTHLLLVALVVLLAALMNPIAERMRARKHAGLIVKALEKAGGSMTAEDLEAACGVHKAADTALRLVTKGYLQDVALYKGSLYLGAPEQTEEEPVATLFHDHEM